MQKIRKAIFLLLTLMITNILDSYAGNSKPGQTPDKLALTQTSNKPATAQQPNKSPQICIETIKEAKGCPSGKGKFFTKCPSPPEMVCQ